MKTQDNRHPLKPSKLSNPMWHLWTSVLCTLRKERLRGQKECHHLSHPQVNGGSHQPLTPNRSLLSYFPETHIETSKAMLLLVQEPRW